MRLFPEREKMKVFMSRWLPVLLAVAWAPLVWMILAALLGSWLQSISCSWQVVMIVLALATLGSTFGLLRLFGLFSRNIFDE
jgi:hypothetical protein